MAAFNEVVFSGVQPTGNLHLGNYLGAIRNFAKLQERDATCLYCVVDLHAITVMQEPGALRDQIREVTAAFLAAGVNYNRSTIFAQSQVPQHAELAWIFNCVARMGWLNRMTQFKDKVGKDAQNASVGLYAYPVLMAADILAYRATHVPVGDDQRQHLELARDIAQKFNNDFSASIDAHGHNSEIGFFPLPAATTTTTGAARVMSLRDGTKKMSKSDPSDNSRINLSDDIDTITSKIRKAKTDPDALPSEIEGLNCRPEATNLVGILAALQDTTSEAILQEYGGSQFSAFKETLAQAVIEKVLPVGEEMRRYLADRGEIDSILSHGADSAEALAQPTLDAVKDILGFVRKGPRLRVL